MLIKTSDAFLLRDFPPGSIQGPPSTRIYFYIKASIIV